jgi:hypothetical protein
MASVRRVACTLVFAVLALSALAGCGSDEQVVESTTTTLAPTPEEVVTDEAAARIETALGLTAESVTASGANPTFSAAADVVLRWDGGSAELDVETGRVYWALQNASSASMAGASFPDSELAEVAQETVRLFGWDAAVMAAEGFTLDQSGRADHAEGAAEFFMVWSGHDAQGVANGALIDIRLDASTKSLRSFAVIPAPETEK